MSMMSGAGDPLSLSTCWTSLYKVLYNALDSTRGEVVTRALKHEVSLSLVMLRDILSTIIVLCVPHDFRAPTNIHGNAEAQEPRKLTELIGELVC